MSVLSAASQPPVALSGEMRGWGVGLSLEEKDVGCDMHTLQKDDPSFEMGVTLDCCKVLPVYPPTKQPTDFES